MFRQGDVSIIPTAEVPAELTKVARDRGRIVLAYGGAPYFDLDSDDRMTAEQWAALMVLHCEAVHGCLHTDQARAELGMIGPRGKAAASP